MNKRKLGWVGLFCFWGALSFGAEPPTDVPLSWEECVALALRHNPDLASSRAGKEAKVSSYRESFNGFLPGFALSNSYADSQREGAGLWEAQLSANLSLWDASRVAEIRSASALVSQAEARQKQASAQLRYDLRTAFLRRVFDGKDIDVSHTIQEIRKKSAELVTLRYESGRESNGNKLRAEAQSLEAAADLAQAHRRARADQRTLYRYLGLPSVNERPVVGSLDTRAPPDFPTVEQRVDGRPDVLLQKISITLQESEVARSRSALWPTLSTHYTRFRTGAHEFPREDTGWTWSGVLNYPLFSGGPTAVLHGITASKKNLEKAQWDYHSVRNQAMVQMETAWSAYAGATEQARVQEALRAAARQRNDEADVRYTSGLLAYDNWEIIVSDRVNQERKAIQAQLTAAVAQATWESAIGIPLEE
ncbi:MAG: TolC family protein [Elusimicrobia bacterium]|nr:TolC family protein [Elusimicrobiota bacterium]